MAKSKPYSPWEHIWRQLATDIGWAIDGHGEWPLPGRQIVLPIIIINLFCLVIQSVLFFFNFFLTDNINTVYNYWFMFVLQTTVVTTKSVEYMPFMLSFFFFLNGGIWAFYALLVGDIFLGVSVHFFFLKKKKIHYLTFLFYFIFCGSRTHSLIDNW